LPAYRKSSSGVAHNPPKADEGRSREIEIRMRK
jgi:hypothetical protein